MHGLLYAPPPLVREMMSGSLKTKTASISELTWERLLPDDPIYCYVPVLRIRVCKRAGTAEGRDGNLGREKAARRRTLLRAYHI